MCLLPWLHLTGSDLTTYWKKFFYFSALVKHKLIFFLTKYSIIFPSGERKPKDGYTLNAKENTEVECHFQCRRSLHKHNKILILKNVYSKTLIFKLSSLCMKCFNLILSRMLSVLALQDVSTFS